MPEARVRAVPFSELRGVRLFALAFGVGACAGSGQPPFSLFWLSLPALSAAYLLWSPAGSWRDGFVRGWAVGAGYFAVSLHWIVEPFLVDVARHGWMAPFALLLLASGLALFWGCAFAVAQALRGRGVFEVLVWAAALTFAELLRGHVLTGFPWALPAYIWADTGLIQLSAFFGSYGLTAATLLFAAGLGGVVAGVERAKLGALVAALACLALVPFFKVTDTPVSADRPIVRLIQPNAPQHEKWDPEKVDIFFERQIAFSAAVTEDAPDLIVWPETAIPWSLERAGPVLERISSVTPGIPVVLGANRRDGGLTFNALAVVGDGGEVQSVYDKHHLVPFGEYIPFGQLAQLIGLRSFAAQDGYGFTSGPGPRLLNLDLLGRAAPLICYEAIFPGNVRGFAERPDMLLQITNDAWFGEIAGPQQHLAQARFRAVEQGLPMIRVANTGISAMIDGHGRIIESLPLGEAGFVDAHLPEPLLSTAYARIGDAPVWGFALVILIAGALRQRNSD